MTRFWKRPVLRLAMSYSVIVTVLCFYTFSNSVIPSQAMIPYLLLRYGVPLWLGLWAIRLIWWLWQRHKGRAPSIDRPIVAWSIEPVISIVLFGLIATEALFHVRFSMSRPLLQSAAEDYQTIASADSTVRFHERFDGPAGLTEEYDGFKTIGLFRILRVNIPTKDCVRFLTTLGGADGGGMVYYLGGGDPPKVGMDHYQHISGTWWRWEADF